MESSGRQERFRRNGALYEGLGVDWPWGQGLKHRQDGLFLKSECGSVWVASKGDQLDIWDRNPGQA